ncbi:hypothetical protein ACFLYT_01265 [Nanoarchaeota archaeon]
MKSLKLIAIFMSVLILTLPIYTAAAFAGSAELDATLTGKNNVPGWRKGTDTVKAEVTALIYEDQFIDGKNTKVYDQITPDQITIDDIEFEDACTTSDGQYYQCSYTGGQDTVSAAQYYDVVLSNDQNSEKERVSDIELSVDELGPTVTIKPEQTIQTSDGIEIAYLVRDRATTSSTITDCSGIQKIEFWEASVLLNTTEIDGHDCAIDSIFKIPSQIDSTGTRTIKVIAYDKLFQSGEDEKSLLIDGTKPYIDALSFTLYLGEKSIETLQPFVKNAITAKVEITEDVGIEYVRADFSALDPNVIDIEANKIKNISNVYTYEWTGINAEVAAGTDSVIIPIEVKDSNGNIKKLSIDYDISVESTAPKVIANTFKMYVGDAEINYISSKLDSIDRIEVDLYEETPGLNINTVWLELTGRADRSPQKCIGNTSTNLWHCIWINEPVSVAKASELVRITAADNWGNSGETTISANIKIDETRPEITYLGTTAKAHPDQDLGLGEDKITSFISTTSLNTVVVEIDEAESGINEGKVELEGWIFNHQPPDRCEHDASLWKCYWENITTPATAQHGDVVEIVVDVRDNVNNHAVNNKAYLYVDTEPPVIKKIGLYSVGPIGLLDYHQAMDPLVLKVEVEDNSPMEFKSSFDTIRLGSDIEGECIPTGKSDSSDATLWSCEVTTGSIPLTGYKKREFKLGLKDSGNNIVTAGDFEEKKDVVLEKIVIQDNVVGALIETDDYKEKLYIEILEVDLTTITPDLWSHIPGDVTSTPHALDRQTITIFGPQRMYYSINFETANTNAELLDVLLDIDSCEGDAVDVIDALDMMNIAGPDKTSPIVAADFKVFSSDEVEAMSMTCNFNIISRLGDVLIINPEIENVTLPVEFYNMPLGGLSEGFQDKVDDIKGGWLGPESGFGQFMEYATLVVKFAKSTCTVLNTLQEIRIVLAFLGTIVDAVAATTKTTGGSGDPAATVQCNSNKAFDKELKDTSETLMGLCNIVSCKCKDEDSGGESKGLSSNTNGCLWDFTEVLNQYKLPVLGGMMSDADPFNSVVIAGFQACLPGLIYGLDKYRQIQCGYVLCMQDDVALGLPPQSCDGIKDYQTCKYVYGELFRALPWVNAYDSIAKEIKQIFEDPLAVIGFVAGFLCDYFCVPGADGKNFGRNLCKLVEMIKIIGKIIGDYKTVVEDNSYGEMFGLKGDLCKEIEV